jgi:hypothetical protein
MFWNKTKELKKEIERLESEKLNLLKEIQILVEQSKNPKKVIESVIGREIKWIDWESMTKQAREDWFKSANGLLNNTVFQHLFGKQVDNEWTNGV